MKSDKGFLEGVIAMEADGSALEAEKNLSLKEMHAITGYTLVGLAQTVQEHIGEERMAAGLMEINRRLGKVDQQELLGFAVYVVQHFLGTAYYAKAKVES